MTIVSGVQTRTDFLADARLPVQEEELDLLLDLLPLRASASAVVLLQARHFQVRMRERNTDM